MKPNHANGIFGQFYFVWIGVFPGADGRPHGWRSPYYPGVTVWRSTRLMALRPYYIDGLPIVRKFRKILQAYTAVEQCEHASAPTNSWLRCPTCNKADATREQVRRRLVHCECDRCGGCGWLLQSEV